jgi:hypothetical protein
MLLSKGEKEEKQGGQMSYLREELSPFNEKGNFFRKVARLLVCIVLILVI